MTTLQSFLLGEWQTGTAAPVSLVNPANGETVAEVRDVPKDFGKAVDYARSVGGANLRKMTFAERGKVLKAMSGVLHTERDSLIEASMLNAGTKRGDAKFDIDGAIGTLAYYASVGEGLGEKTVQVDEAGIQLTRSPRFWGYHVRTPLRGVAVHVNAFNFPAWGLAEKAAVALLAGMPVISKPATSTALLAFRCMEKLVAAKALPDGALQFVAGGTGDLLSRLGSQDVLAFTGSGATGELFRKLENVVHHSVRVNVEADSLNAMVLGPDVEAGSDSYGLFIREVVREMTQKTGQKCTAVRRIFVPAARMDEVQGAVSEELARIKIGDPTNETVRMGPLATAAQWKDVKAGIGQLVAGGARLVHGNAEAPTLVAGDASKGCFLGPVLARVDTPHTVNVVHDKEVFGPVATLMPYADADDAVALVAKGEGGLLASVVSDDAAFTSTVALGLAPLHGRIWIGSRKVADQATAPGIVLPSCVHGGPGRAGGGEELGGTRGMGFYTQRTALQGDRAVLERMLGVTADATAG